MMPNQPIVVCGAHRSGTSLVSELLQSAGVFMGADQETNRESLSFIRFNDWLLSLAGGSWSSPVRMDGGFSQRELRLIDNALCRSVTGLPMLRYRGIQHALTPIGGLSPWGWKDPRNTYTARFWRRIFPEAKFILVERHGIDVAASLYRRHQRRLDAAIERWDASWYRTLVKVRRKRGYFGGPEVTATLDSAFDLWLQYLDAGRSLSGDKSIEVLQISYEELISRAPLVLERMASFLGLDELATVTFEPRQAPYAYRRDNRLMAWAQGRVDDLEHRGYRLLGDASCEPI